MSLCLCGLSFFQNVHAQSQEFSLNSDSTIQWQFRKAGDTSWHDATVPGCVHTDLLANKLIPDPFYRDNESKVQWVENEDWEYQTFFDCGKDFLSEKHLELHFDGLDTYADVYVNDSLILRADNMFRSWNVDVKKLLREKNNHLFIHFYSVAKKGKELAAQLNYKLPGDEGGKAFERKAQYQFGWDWGPRLVTCGVWKNVKLN
ncbi:MAG: glycosyl hydrolase 2 galactose-binding domain-containing protein, partial [Chitinophagales bacterium]